MAPIKISPAEILRAELARQSKTLPIFLRPKLGEVLGMLDNWVSSTEARIAALEKERESFPLIEEEVLARQRPRCAGCDD